MDFTPGFKKLREALPLIDLSGRCYGDENFIPAPYSDPIEDAGYFGGVGIDAAYDEYFPNNSDDVEQ